MGISGHPMRKQSSKFNYWDMSAGTSWNILAHMKRSLPKLCTAKHPAMNHHQSAQLSLIYRQQTTWKRISGGFKEDLLKDVRNMWKSMAAKGCF